MIPQNHETFISQLSLSDEWENCNSITLEFARGAAGSWFSKAFEPRFRSFAYEFADILRIRAVF